MNSEAYTANSTKPSSTYLGSDVRRKLCMLVSLHVQYLACMTSREMCIVRSTQVDFMKRVVQKGHVESVYHSANHVYSRVKFLYRDGYFSTQVAGTTSTCLP